MLARVRKLRLKWKLPRREPRMATEWFCTACQRWSGTTCCAGCLRINPADVRWMTEREIQEARRQVTK